MDNIERLLSENERLRAALKPFADYGDLLEGVNWCPDLCPLATRPDQPEGAITVGDLRRARSALGKGTP